MPRQPSSDPQSFDTGDWLLAQLDAAEAEGWWTPTEILRLAAQPGPRLVLWLWTLLTAVAIASGIFVVAQNLSGIPIDLGFRTVHVTLYPPLAIGMLMFLWLGPLWAMVTTYLATFALGAYAGIAWLPNSLFAASDTILILVVWSGMTVLEIPPVVRKRGDWFAFLSLSLTGCVASSVGALVWNYTQGLAFPEALGIWEGWVVGAFLVILGVVVPTLLVLRERPRAWLERKLHLSPRPLLSLRAGTTLLICALALFASIAVIVARLFLQSLPATGTLEFRNALVARLPELTLFASLVMVSVGGTVTLFIVALTRRSERERLAARRDRLTGCRNRRGYTAIVARETNRAKRLGDSMSLIFIDVDDFKGINDRHGHLVGDRVLQIVSERVARQIRSTDYLFRWGGDEFAVLLPHTLGPAAAGLAARIKAVVASAPVRAGDPNHPVGVRVSTGIATTSPDVDPRRLLSEAIASCLEAKSCHADDRQDAPAPVL